MITNGVQWHRASSWRLSLQAVAGPPVPQIIPRGPLRPTRPTARLRRTRMPLCRGQCCSGHVVDRATAATCLSISRPHAILHSTTHPVAFCHLLIGLLFAASSRWPRNQSMRRSQQRRTDCNRGVATWLCLYVCISRASVRRFASSKWREVCDTPSSSHHSRRNFNPPFTGS